MRRLTSENFVTLRDQGGDEQRPPVRLNPYTKVDVEREVDPPRFGQFEAGKYYKVKVLEGGFMNSEGYLPEAALSRLSPWALQGVGLSTDMVPNTSGIRYGMDVKEGEDRYVIWKAYCNHCGEAPALHILHETTAKSGANGTREDFEKLRAAITQGKIKQVSPAMMLGVLHVASGLVYASHSNQQNNEAFRVLVEKLGWRYGGPTGQNEILNRRGEKATNGKPDSNLQGFDYQCAAPRLIQQALREKEYPTAMTEGYSLGPLVGPKDQRVVQPVDHTIRSCPRCLKTVPYMLCPE